MTPSIEYASYLVHLCREVGADRSQAAADWQGEVEQIQTGERRTFDTLGEPLNPLRQGCGGCGAIRSVRYGRT